MSADIKRFWPLLLFAAFHAVIFMVIFGGAFPEAAHGGSRSLFFFYADRVFDGALPYQDFHIEYAPVSLAFFLLPRVFAHTDAAYHVAFALELLLFDLLGLVVLADLAKRLGYPLRGTLIGSTVALLALGPIVVDHFDLIAAIMVLIAIYALVREWNTAAWVMLGLAAMTKIFPIILVPVFAIYLLRRGQVPRVLKGGVVLGLTLIAVSLPGILINFDGFADSFTYHSQRGLQAESTYASAIFAGDELGLTSADTAFEPQSGSWEITTPLADRLASPVAPVLTIFALLAVYVFYWWLQINRDLSDSRLHWRWLIGFSMLAILVFLLGGKVLSPQYIIWLFPLAVLIGGQHRAVAVLLFMMLAILTQDIYPYTYPGGVGHWFMEHTFSTSYLDLVSSKEPRAVYVLVGRNGLLLLASVLLGWRLARLMRLVEVASQ